jgi:predicted GH43/DUF377 family glycosyl hydrolase
MNKLRQAIRHLDLRIRPDPRRVLLRPFLPTVVVKPLPAREPNPRIAHLFSRVMQLDEASVTHKLDEVFEDFRDRHQRIHDLFAQRFQQIRSFLPTGRPLNEPRRLLLGSFFTSEYSLESAALFNPSIVPAPDQGGVPEGAVRFVLSLRATGEGHVSSITFRTGTVDRHGDVTLDQPSRFVQEPRPQPAALYELETFRRKLVELGVEYDSACEATAGLPADFLMSELDATVRALRSRGAKPGILRAGERAILLAQANYTVRFGDTAELSERILFPFAPSESNGIEDARFVRLDDADGGPLYVATYTAYDGNVVLPQMVHTRDFQQFSICTLNGPAVRNKGLALFPRKIRGQYAMLGRQDGENIHLMFSDHLHFWYESSVLLRPSEPWEFVQIGNCGSPVELDDGWLVVTHGVGPMRKYCLGAVLLDKSDPARVLGRLRQPLIHPDPSEREGYVPNVVYSCGSMAHRGNLILPYAVSDSLSRFAVIPLRDLVEQLRADGP